MIDKYINAIKSGVVTGYGFIDSLSDKQIQILCSIASSVSKTQIAKRDDLKRFSANAQIGDKTFNRYAENVMLAYAELNNV